MNGVNLFISYLILSGSLYTAVSASEAAPLLYLILDLPAIFGWIPFLFSSLFFIIPAIRWFQIRRLTRNRQEKNIRKRIFKAVYRKPLKFCTIDYVLREVNGAVSEVNLSSDIIKKMMDELILDQEGNMVITEEASVAYTFPHINLEQSEVEHIRSSSRPETSLGQIILDAD